MSAPELVRVRQEAERARQRLAATVAELQQRLKPGTLAGQAWEGVKDKGGELAVGAVGAVKARPVAVSAALAVFTLFLARAPIRSAMTRLLADEKDENLVTARLDGGDDGYDLTAPVAAGATSEGAKT
jgi:hypothetical protein